MGKIRSKIKKRSIFKKYNLIRSFKNFVGLTKKETSKERRSRHKKDFNNFVEKRKKEKEEKKKKKEKRKKEY